MIQEMCQQARQASKALALLSSDVKRSVLQAMATQLWTQRGDILKANQVDVEQALEAGLSGSMLDRLTLNESRIQSIVNDLHTVADLPDPVGEIFAEKEMPNGLHVYQQRVPLGVLAVIYEARPNVTVDVTGLALKSGNAVILRGGSETLRTNTVLVQIIRDTLRETGLPDTAVQFINDPDRALVGELLKMYEDIDMLIPRGGAALHKFCREHSLIPVITGGIGICHLYVDDSADPDPSVRVIQNAKVQRPTVCNALDTVLLHEKIAAEALQSIIASLSKEGVTFRLDDKALALYGSASEIVQKAGPEDFDQEWLSLVLGIKVVSGLEEAIDHIALHSTAHSDGILTGSKQHAERFLAEVDSAVVYVNASTRFTDGSQLGLGAEVAISTQRLHARGPMALQELTTYKWVVQGDYHTRP